MQRGTHDNNARLKVRCEKI